MSDNTQILLATILYISIVIGIGVKYAKQANESSDNYLIGGRSLGPWVTAMAAEASDMSGWLLMGLPGVAYWLGLADAFWTAVGLLIGTYINWLIVARRIRNYSQVANDSITIPDFISNRFKENKKVLMTIAALFILIFFSVYAASCFVVVGKLFNGIFGVNYQLLMIIGAIFVVAYTFVGGFLAESVSDFMQGIVMFITLTLVTFLAVRSAGGFSAIVENVRNFPGFMEFFGMATPETVKDVQQVVDNVPQFSAARTYGVLTIISTLSWGLGYFGMPQVLTKFMAIRSADEVKVSRRVAVVWVIISLFAAVILGVVGRALYPTEFTTLAAAENIFVHMSTSFFPPFLAGIVSAGILAATISSSDSYLLIASSAFSKNIYQGILKKDATDKQVLKMSHVALIIVSIIAVIIAFDDNSVIFSIVSFAWAGFGATFGPLILFALFWKRTTRAGAIAGMLVGGGMVFLWKLVLNPLLSEQIPAFGIYELLPAFLLSTIVIFIVSKITTAPSDEIVAEFEKVKSM